MESRRDWALAVSRIVAVLHAFGERGRPVSDGPEIQDKSSRDRRCTRGARTPCVRRPVSTGRTVRWPVRQLAEERRFAERRRFTE
jgi:hypothetical protein